MVEFIKYKKRRRKFTYKEKKEIVNEYELSGLNTVKYAEQVNICCKSLQKWIRNKEKILSMENDLLIRCGSGRKTLIPKTIETELLQYILDIRAYKIPVSDDLIKSRGKYLLQESKLNIDCNFSNGWLSNYKKKYNICRRKGGSKIVSIDNTELNVITSFIEEIKNDILSDVYDSIINIDETGVYYDSPINFTLDIKGTKRVEIITTGREKRRITVILGVDLLNMINIKPFIILEGKTKQCLKDVNKNGNYNLSYQKNSWCTDDQFIKFISTFPNDKKILLLFDNFKGHKTEKVNNFLQLEYPLITVKTLPPNTTSILQPLDVGINRPFKVHIKNKYLEWLIKHFNNKQNILGIKKKKEQICL